MNAGRTLRAIRCFHRVSMSESARHLGYTKSYISDLENGKKPPSLDVLERYAEAFSIPVSSIMLLVESDTDDPATFRSSARKKVTRKILDILELMAPKDEEGTKSDVNAADVAAKYHERP